MEPHDHNRWMNSFLQKLQLAPNMRDGAALTSDMLDALRYSLEGQMYRPDEILCSPSMFDGLSKILSKGKTKKK